jgi:chitodextrinase
MTVPLKWNKVTGADYYRVYRHGISGNIGSSEDTQITIGGLKPNTSYTFTVRAVGDDGKLGPASSSKTVKTKK